MRRIYFNLMVVFIISGLWHGSNWTYIIWGCINGFYLVFALMTKNIREKFNRVVGFDKVPKISMVVNIVITFTLICFSRVFFRARNVEEAFLIFKKMITFKGSIFNDGSAILIYCFAAIFFLLAVEIKKEFFDNSFSLSNNKRLAIRVAYFSFLIWTILLAGVYDGGQFIYFQF